MATDIIARAIGQSVKDKTDKITVNNNINLDIVSSTLADIAEQISQLSEQKADKFLSTGKNLFNKSNVIPNTRIDSFGVVEDNVAFSTSEYIPVEENTTYYKNENTPICYYTANKELISGSFSTYQFTTPSNCRYIRTSFTTSELDNRQIEKGDKATPYESYRFNIDIPIIAKTNNIADKAITKEKISNGAVGFYETDFLEIGKNLFNKDDVTHGLRISSLNELTENEVYSTTNYILVEPDTTYYKNELMPISYYDESKNYISGSFSTYQFTTPSNCRYIRTSFTTSELDNRQIEKGEDYTGYEPFKVTLKYSSKEELGQTENNLIELNVIAFNVGHWNSGDGYGHTGDMETFKQNWRQFINNTRFDIMGLCEFTPYVDADNTILAQPLLFDDVIKDNYNHTSSELSVQSRLPIISLTTMSVGTTLTRTIIKFNVNINNKIITIYHVHLSPSTYFTERAEQITDILEDAENNQYTMIIGDLNAQNISEYDVFKENGYTIANGGYLGTVATLRDIPADNIIVSNNLLIKYFNVDKTVSLSNHFPLQAIVTFK